MKEKANQPVYGPWARFLRAMARLILFQWSVAAPCQSPCVYIVHHRNMFGPIHALLLMRDMPRPWVLHVFLDRHSCFEHYYNYTFTERFGWPRWLAYIAASVLSWVVPGTLRSFGAIPVYRDLRRTHQIMRETGSALERGESILLCPDIAYDSDSAATGKIYKGFLRLDKPYRERTGKPLRFVPVFCSHTRRIEAAAPIYCAENLPLRAAREDAARRIVESLNALAVQTESPKEKDGRACRKKARPRSTPFSVG